MLEDGAGVFSGSLAENEYGVFEVCSGKGGLGGPAALYNWEGHDLGGRRVRVAIITPSRYSLKGVSAI